MKKDQTTLRQKIAFRFHSNVLDQEIVETMWAIVVDEVKGMYQLDNIPFYATMASGDIVYAEHDEKEEMLAYRHTLQYSANSTIQVIVMDEKTETNHVRELFRKLGCVSEKCGQRYFSMEVPAKVDYLPIKEKLDELESQEIIGYAEPRLAEVHRYFD